MFFDDIFKISLNISNTEYDPSGNSNSLFHVVADILDLLFFYHFFNIFTCILNAKV